LPRSKPSCRAIQSGFYLSDDLTFSNGEEGAEEYFCINGTIQCLGGMRVQVKERLRFARPYWWSHTGARRRVTLVSYSYSIVLLNEGVLVRYDSPHEDHNRFHHAHRFDPPGSAVKQLIEVPESGVPGLREVLHEAEAWHWEHQADR
jgi:hypothetical protein